MKTLTMKPLFIYSTIVAFMFMGCAKDETEYSADETQDPFEETEYPSNYTVDINLDGIDDFAVEYRHIATTDVPVSAVSIIGSFIPMNDVSCLYRAYDGNLFLSPNDTIYDTYTSPNHWFNYDADLVNKDWARNSGWDEFWEVISPQNEYYFAFKLQNGTTNELGWLKFEIDVNTGDIEIVDMASTNSNFIVI